MLNGQSCSVVENMERKNPKCDRCGLKFLLQIQLIQHTRIKHPQNEYNTAKFRSPDSDAEFSSKEKFFNNNNHSPSSPRRSRQKSSSPRQIKELRKSRRGNYTTTSPSITSKRKESRKIEEDPNDKRPCLICTKILPNKKLLAIHLRKVHSAKGYDISSLPARIPVIMREAPSFLTPWKCKKCGKYFSIFHKLWKHRINICGLGTTYRCPYCPSQFRQFIELCVHRRTHNTRGQLRLKVKQLSKFDYPKKTTSSISTGKGNKIKNSNVCTFCQEKFKSKLKLSEHVENQHRLFMCLQCPSVLPTRERLDKHILNKHTTIKNGSLATLKSNPKKDETNNNNVSLIKVDAQQLFQKSKRVEDEKSSVSSTSEMKCKECQLNFTVLGQYLKHLRDHKPGNWDDIQTETNLNLFNNSSHKPTTNGVLAMEMDEIEDLFEGNHTSYKYSEADTVSVSSDELKDRKRIKKIESGHSSPFKCGICSREFSKVKTFYYHMSQQICKPKKYPYNCFECRQGFSREATLKQHMKIHEPEEPELDNQNDSTDPDVMKRKCKICAKVFATQQTMLRHLTSLHSEIQVDPEPQFNGSLSLSPPPPPPPVNNCSIIFPCMMQRDCSQTFNSVQELSNHLANSHPNHPFSICPRPSCWIPFRSEKLLKKHLLEDHGKK